MYWYARTPTSQTPQPARPFNQPHPYASHYADAKQCGHAAAYCDRTLVDQKCQECQELTLRSSWHQSSFDTSPENVSKFNKWIMQVDQANGSGKWIRQVDQPYGSEDGSPRYVKQVHESNASTKCISQENKPSGSAKWISQLDQPSRSDQRIRPVDEANGSAKWIKQVGQPDG